MTIVTPVASAAEPQPVAPLNLQQLVVPTSAEWKSVQTLLQGNIAKSHGRRLSALLAIEIHPEPNSRKGLKDLANDYVTSAQEQEARIEPRRERRKEQPGYVDTHIFGFLYLSRWGYQKLGYEDAALEAAFPGSGSWFMTGMEAQQSRLADAEHSIWEPLYQDQKIDALLLLACDDFKTLENEIVIANKKIAVFGKVLGRERGAVLRNRAGQRVEHFGFADGVTMPEIFAGSSTPVLPQHLLVQDVLAGEDHAFGSYLTYCKLEQDVAGFEQAIKALALATGVSIDYAGAMVIGRFKDGTPLSNSDVPLGASKPAEPNYNAAGANRCPFHAHIRKANPRINIDTPGAEIKNPIFRRGVPYGSFPQHDKVGMLFLAFQSNISGQFGSIMGSWINNPEFPKPHTGTDTLMGKSCGAQQWPGKKATVSFELSRLVTLKGGEFFFAPSLAFFRRLA